jgi:hypothetical protein
MSWGIEVLVEGLLRVECLVALVALEDVSRGIQALLQCVLAAEVSITRLTVVGHFAQRLLSTKLGDVSSTRDVPRSMTVVERLLPSRSA